MGLASEPELSQLRFPETLDVPKLGTAWEKHIYQSETGSYFAELNEWEQEVVRSELSDPSVSYWLRSIPRKPWALAIPYLGDSGQFKTLYPDFIFIRKVGDGSM